MIHDSELRNIRARFHNGSAGI